MAVSLGGLRVLVVEDQMLVALEMELLLQRLGCAVIGPAGNLGDAERLAAEATLDAAILDVNLGGQLVWPVAEILHRRGVPFVLTTGYSLGTVPPPFRDCCYIEKPITPPELEKALSVAVAQSAHAPGPATRASG